MRIKLLFLFLIGCIIAKYLAAPSEIQAEKQDYKLKVGVIFPLSGPAASVGNAAKNGMQLAYQNLSDDLKNRLEIFYEDDSLSPAKSISSYRRLLQDIGVQVVVNASSITGKALSPIAERDQIPLITISSDPEVVENRKFVVSFWVNAEDEAEAILMEARRRGYKKIARVTSSDPFCLAIHAAFDSKNNDDPEVMLDEEYTAEVKDFRTYLSRISTNKEIDAIMLGLMPGQLGIFAKQARSMGLTIPFFGYEMMEDLNELKVSE
ncbi:MAG: ABC transporter substrate-binding protein, partial [Bdellovibrionales bacterium]|nr:ABC transporter substrate-binding protein [Bdellovibrionales bacterium]